MRIMGESRCTWMWAKNELVHDLSSPSSVLQTLASRSADMNSWEELAFAEDVSGSLGGCVWPPRSYSCSFCRRDFRSAQALGGHMNVHRRDRAAALLKQQSPASEVVLPQQIHASKPCTSSFDDTTPASRVSTTLWYINPNPELFSDAGLLVLSPSSHATRVSSPPPPKKVNNYDREKVFVSPVVDSDDQEILDSIKSCQEKNSKNYRAKKQDLLTDKDLSRDLNLAVCRRKKRYTSMSDEEVTSNCKRRRLMMEAKPSLSFFPKLISTVNDTSDHLPQSETMFKVLIKSGSVDGELDLELRLGGALI